MAIANLQETLLMYTLRKSDLLEEISNLNSQKNIALAEQADVNPLLSASRSEIRADFRRLFEESPELQDKYKDYTEIPEFEEEMNRIEAMYQEQLAEINNWETQLDNQITTDSAELEEINAWIESFKSMLSSNIQDDFDLGLGN